MRSLLTRSAIVAALAVLCACGSSSSSSSTSAPASQSGSSCQYSSDSVIAEAPVVEVSPPGSTAPQPLSKDTNKRMACGTLLTVVGQSGNAQATFGTQGLCTLQEYQHQPASLISRAPNGYLLTLQTGDLTCSVNGPVSLPPGTIKCPYGKVRVTQRAQFWEKCAPDPVFQVAVHMGTVEVTGPNEVTTTVAAGSAVAFDFSTGAFSPPEPALFTNEQKAIFRTQALALPPS